MHDAMYQLTTSPQHASVWWLSNQIHRSMQLRLWWLSKVNLNLEGFNFTRCGLKSIVVAGKKLAMH
jgi:hypothetical protein